MVKRRKKIGERRRNTDKGARTGTRRERRLFPARKRRVRYRPGLATNSSTDDRLMAMSLSSAVFTNNFARRLVFPVNRACLRTRDDRVPKPSFAIAQSSKMEIARKCRVRMTLPLVSIVQSSPLVFIFYCYRLISGVMVGQRSFAGID